MKRHVALEAAAKGARARVAVGFGFQDPALPIDAALRLGLQVRLVGLGSLEGMYEPGSPGLILVGSERPFGRRNFTCAHELGHHYFSHGRRVDELIAESLKSGRDIEELQADRFAAEFLMPKSLVIATFAKRGWLIPNLTPEQVYVAAGSIGVGYSTLIDHMAITLRMLPYEQRHHLRRHQPKDIRASLLGFECRSDLFVVDSCWLAKVVDLQVDDLMLVPGGTKSHTPTLEARAAIGTSVLLEAKRAGISPIKLAGTGPDLAVRISRRGFTGLAENRHLPEPEE